MLKKGETKIAKCFIFGQKELYKYVCVCVYSETNDYLPKAQRSQTNVPSCYVWPDCMGPFIIYDSREGGFRLRKIIVNNMNAPPNFIKHFDTPSKTCLSNTIL